MALRARRAMCVRRQLRGSLIRLFSGSLLRGILNVKFWFLVIAGPTVNRRRLRPQSFVPA
jgi:hypothetical protein